MSTCPFTVDAREQTARESPPHPGPDSPTPGPASRTGLWREILLIAALFVGYRLVRLGLTGHDALALANAWQVWGVERTLGMPDEEAVQAWFLQWPDVLRAANWYYVSVHFPLTVAFLAWGWWRRPTAEYRWARRLLTVVTAIALFGHTLLPLAPPRMLATLGFVDTMAVYGPSAYKGSAASVANQFAAMPSLHVGWAMLIAVVVVRTMTSRWRWVVVLHPVMTLAVVIVTANHYWVDALAAAVVLGLALLITPGVNAPAPLVGWWQQAREGREPDQAMSKRTTSPSVGTDEPPAGSIVRPRASEDFMSSTKASSSPPLPRTPTD